MIEKTTVEIKIIYDHTDVMDAVLMSRTYQKLGFRISESDTPKDGNKGYYVMSLECEGFDHLIFSLANRSDFEIPKGELRDLVEKITGRKT